MKTKQEKETEVNVSPGRASFLAGLAVVLVILMSFVFWKIGWWFQAANTNQQYNVDTHSEQYQSSLVSQERDRVAGWEVATNPAQKLNIGQSFCSIYLSLTIPPEDLVQAHQQICN